MNTETARVPLAKEFFPGLARLFACQLDPYARRGSYRPLRWTTLLDPGDTRKPIMAWADNGRAEPTDPEMMGLFQRNQKVFQDSFATRDMHGFGYIHDQMILWGTDFPKAVASLQKDKKKYKDKNDSKKFWQAEIAKATEEIANGELDRETPTQPFEVDENARDPSIDDMASDAMYAFRFIKAHPNPKDQKQRVHGLTTEQKHRIEAQNLISKEMHRHPLSEVSWTPPDIEDKDACDQWEADYWDLPHFDDTDACDQW